LSASQKSPRVYLADSGILHALLGIATQDDLDGHPKAGASFEGMVISTLATRYRATPEECFFWRTHTGAELDFLIVRGNRRYGFEIKMTLAPKTTWSMHSALADLNLESLRVVYPGRERFAMGEKIIALPLSQVFTEPLDLFDSGG